MKAHLAGRAFKIVTGLSAVVVHLRTQTYPIRPVTASGNCRFRKRRRLARREPTERRGSDGFGKQRPRGATKRVCQQSDGFSAVDPWSFAGRPDGGELCRSAGRGDGGRAITCCFQGRGAQTGTVDPPNPDFSKG